MSDRIRTMVSLPTISDVKSAAADLCRSQPVVLAYVFGSHARGMADAESDIDIAVLTDPSLSKDERFDLRFRLMRHLAVSKNIPVEKIDLVVLQDVPVLLQYNVIRNGQMLFERSAGVRHDFEFSVEQRYEDEAPSLDREADMTIQRILNRHASL